MYIESNAMFIEIITKPISSLDLIVLVYIYKQIFFSPNVNKKSLDKVID